MMDLLKEAMEHAEQQMPRESCGLVVHVKGEDFYYRCRNVAEGKNQFVMAAEDYATAEDAGMVKMVVHSHCYLPPTPTQADRVACNRSGLPWMIVSVPNKTHLVIAPNEDRLPYLERIFCHGVVDCYTLAEDYYREEFGVTLPTREEFGWSPGWWQRGEELYSDANFAKHGFVRVDIPEKGDLLTMNVVSKVPNHIAIFVGNSQIIHHLQGRLSSKDVYGGYWAKHTRGTYRRRPC